MPSWRALGEPLLQVHEVGKLRPLPDPPPQGSPETPVPEGPWGSPFHPHEVGKLRNPRLTRYPRALQERTSWRALG
eukprot:NODE_2984_length_999_cov_6.788421_g2496_i0.p5 GENE.NODE_2984_length_999_cov_6.788421_g2496_i0~~NODE_2984_length_999_cov_6.788421_g2496_i0.p5  ORF type:complete len:76 (+),score=0.67 NODE_2984_length_999_cov_6.788421_g2496_i0:298-525(+)